MSEYRRILEQLARHNVSERMPSATISQATDWLEVALRFAQNEVRVYADSLDWEPLSKSRVVAAASAFLSRGGSIKLLLRKNGTCSSHFLRDQPGVDARVAKGSYATPTTRLFAVVDLSGYRFEQNPKMVVANFNEPGIALNLVRAFDDAFKLAHRVVPSENCVAAG